MRKRNDMDLNSKIKKNMNEIEAAKVVSSKKVIKEEDNILNDLRVENEYLKIQILDLKQQLFEIFQQNIQFRKLLMSKESSVQSGNVFNLHHQQKKLYQNQLRKQNKINEKNQIIQNLFIRECTEQIQRLKGLIRQLSQEKQRAELCQTASERQQIKDRIIMKLQDQLITIKLQLKQQKIKNCQTNLQENYMPPYPLNTFNRNKGNYTDRFC